MTKTLLDIAFEKYLETFGENYPLLVVDLRSDEEIAKDIAECVKSKKKAERQKYESGIVY